MKLISLNILGGHNTKELLLFIRRNTDVDIFCFQEVFDKGICTRPEMEGSNMNIFSEIACGLKGYKGYFAPHQDNEEGLSIFVKNVFNIEEYNDVFVHRDKNAMINNHGEELGRNIQHIMLKYKGKKINIINFHGLWSKLGKVDTTERELQSIKILDFLKILRGEVILCGDFNLMPDTYSIKLFRDYGLRDLIKKFKITSTRSSMYKGEVKYADYIFCSEGLVIKNFKVFSDEVSDHLPLYLEFSV